MQRLTRFAFAGFAAVFAPWIAARHGRKLRAAGAERLAGDAGFLRRLA